MKVIEYLYQKVSGDRHVLDRFWRGLRGEYPQINEKTEVRLTDYRELRIPRMSSTPTSWVNAARSFSEPDWTPEDWRWWYNGLFISALDRAIHGLEGLDAPEFRWQYSLRVWRRLAMLPGMVWRWLTKDMQREVARWKGEKASQPPAPVVAYEYDTVELKGYGVRIEEPDWRRHMGEPYRNLIIYVGYYAPTDTLYAFETEPLPTLPKPRPKEETLEMLERLIDWGRLRHPGAWDDEI